MAQQKGKPYRRLILLSMLQMADDTIVSRGLILYLVRNTSTKRVIEPKMISSKCNIYWRSLKKSRGTIEPTKAQKKRILSNLVFALNIVLSNHHIYRKAKAEQLEAKLPGWEKERKNKDKK